MLARMYAPRYAQYHIKLYYGIQLFFKLTLFFKKLLQEFLININLYSIIAFILFTVKINV